MLTEGLLTEMGFGHIDTTAERQRFSVEIDAKVLWNEKRIPKDRISGRLFRELVKNVDGHCDRKASKMLEEACAEFDWFEFHADKLSQRGELGTFIEHIACAGEEALIRYFLIMGRNELKKKALVSDLEACQEVPMVREIWRKTVQSAPQNIVGRFIFRVRYYCLNGRISHRCPI